jgi:hypothetical protein
VFPPSRGNLNSGHHGEESQRAGHDDFPFSEFRRVLLYRYTSKGQRALLVHIAMKNKDAPPRDAIVQLRFTPALDLFSPPKALNVIRAWERLCGYFAFMSTDEDARKRMTALWISYCTLEANRALPLLNRVEGCIGGDKQIRGVFRSTEPDAAWSPENFELRFEVRNSEVCRWTYEELKDLIDAFEKLCVDVVHPDSPVSGEVAVRWRS